MDNPLVVLRKNIFKWNAILYWYQKQLLTKPRPAFRSKNSLSKFITSQWSQKIFINKSTIFYWPLRNILQKRYSKILVKKYVGEKNFNKSKIFYKAFKSHSFKNHHRNINIYQKNIHDPLFVPENYSRTKKIEIRIQMSWFVSF